MKYAWIDTQGKAFELARMCDALEVSVSGFRAWKRGGTPDWKRLTDSQMPALVHAIHAELKGAYGSPRVVREPRGRGFSASKDRVERLMRENGIRARHKRRFKVTTDSKHGLPVAPNLLDRNFTATGPDQVYSSDITYLWTDEGWLYLAIVLDLFNREVIGWSLKPRMTTDIVLDALTMDWFRRRHAPGVLHHSDRGSQGGSNWSSQHLQRIRDDLLDEPKGQLLGQCPDGELVQQLQERAGPWHPVHDTRRNEVDGIRIHRDLLQSEAPALDAGLPVAGAFHGALARGAAGETGSINPPSWKTKNRGKLTWTDFLGFATVWTGS